MSVLPLLTLLSRKVLYLRLCFVFIVLSQIVCVVLCWNYCAVGSVFVWESCVMGTLWLFLVGVL